MWPLDPVALHAVTHVIPAHPQQPRRPRHVPPGLRQRLPDPLGLCRLPYHEEEILKP
jgi:hypothetical protein